MLVQRLLFHYQRKIKFCWILLMQIKFEYEWLKLYLWRKSGLCGSWNFAPVSHEANACRNDSVMSMCENILDFALEIWELESLIACQIRFPLCFAWLQLAIRAGKYYYKVTKKKLTKVFPPLIRIDQACEVNVESNMVNFSDFERLNSWFAYSRLIEYILHA